MVRAAVSAFAVIGLAACASAAGQPPAPSSSAAHVAGAPVQVIAVPVSPPPAVIERHSCFVPGTNRSGTASNRGVVSVDPHPIAAVAEWLPGLNQRPCRAQLTHIGQPAARRLAATVNTGKAIRVGAVYFCPSDDGSTVALFFEFPGHAIEKVSVDLTGCRWITAPARISRFAPAALYTELDKLAPAPWRP